MLLLWSTGPKEKSEEAQHHVQLEGQEQTQVAEQPVALEQQVDEQPVSREQVDEQSVSKEHARDEQPLPVSQEQNSLNFKWSPGDRRNSRNRKLSWS